VRRGGGERRRRCLASAGPFVLPAGPTALALRPERDSRRRQILDAILASGQATALIYYGKGRDTEIRAESFRRMVDPLIDRNVVRLIVESREGRDDLDRQVLVGQLRSRPDAFLYDHMPPHGDPLLWIADALAWCSSAGGPWQERTDAITISQDALNGPEQREARPLTVRRGAGLTS
jgi:hypothetical protein